MHYAISMKVLGQTHMWYTHKRSNFLEIFQFLWVFKFSNTLKNRTSKVRSTKTNTKQNLKKNHWCKAKGKWEVITQKSKGASNKTLVSSLWHTRTRPKCFKLHALKNADSMRGQESSKRRPKGAQAKGDSERHLIGNVMEMLKNISLCLASFTPRFESYIGHTFPSRTLTQNTRKVWVKKCTYEWSLLMSMH